MDEALTDSKRLGLTWRKSSGSLGNAECVELASAKGHVAVRDSKNPDGPALLYTKQEFKAFVSRTKTDGFDGPA